MPPVPLAPYPTPPAPYTQPSNATQSQLVCSGCRNLLLYPVGATSVCCAVCNAVTAVPAPGTEMAQLVCGGCHTLLMYIRGATSVQCSCCHTVNLALEDVNKCNRSKSIIAKVIVNKVVQNSTTAASPIIRNALEGVCLDLTNGGSSSYSLV
ncbi:protein LOL1 [Cucumis melo var. makuwa]|uniref:Protein LOL1 n=1 Tax=Cucumis melo var. makuwa TaxID=1194695 RepID=A0A5A7T554_CUCMM|nr:protein LOL1 [Cucumis melo var. makuwa]TYK31149.1 protein LOL1 [Cucumis melo var. makuwa]